MAKLPIKTVAQRKLDEALERLKETNRGAKKPKGKKAGRGEKYREPKRSHAPGDEG